MSVGSLQLRAYLRARRAGTPTEEAAEQSGFSLAEARLTDADEAKGLLADIDTSDQTIGHNSGDHDMADDSIDTVTAAKLRQFTERAERLIEEKKGIQDDIRDTFAEAKAMGFDPAAMKIVIRQRAMDKQKRETLEAVVETYQLALGL